MKKYIKIGALAVFALMGMTACVNDLNVESIDPNNVSDITSDQLLGKIYSTLGTTGQQGPAGNRDIEGLDEGTSSLYRMTYELNEFPSDQVYWIWPDVGVDDVRKGTWTAGNALVRGAYCRYIFDITLCNSYLENYADVDAAKTAEVRFIRALNYWYLLDMFGACPFNITAAEMDAYAKAEELMGDYDNYPKQITRKNLYEWIESELLAIENQLTVDRNAFYYRVDKVAAQMLLARLYLNAQVYTADPAKFYALSTGTPEWEKAAKYAKMVMDATELASKYQYLFMGDNDNISKVNDAYKEIILPVAQEGSHIRSYGASLFLLASFYTDGLPSWGITDSWKCMRTRKQLVSLFFPTAKNWNVPEDLDNPAGEKKDDKVLSIGWFTTNDKLMKEIEKCPYPLGDATLLTKEAKDDRALFCNYREYNDSSLIICNLNRENADDKFFSGWLCTKFSNNMADPTRVRTDAAHPDMDLPLMRAAEAYLTYAEAQFRLGGDALTTINELRKRANAEPLTTIDENTIRDEWGREFYAEGRRRTDLVRLDMFVGNKYGWEWKAGNQFGQKPLEEHRVVFPLPLSDVTANPNLRQYTDLY